MFAIFPKFASLVTVKLDVVVVFVLASKVMFPAVKPFLTLKFLVATVPYIPVYCMYLVPT